MRSGSNMNKGTRYGPSTEAVRAILTKYRPELVFALLFLIITVFLFRGYLHSTNPLGTDAMGLPFIIEASDSTTVVPPGWTVTVHASRSLVLRPSKGRA